MTADSDNPTFRRDPKGVGSYYRLTQEKVAYSVPLSDLVIADIDAAGELRGIEFVGKQTEPLDAYIVRARKASLGPCRKSRGPVSGSQRDELGLSAANQGPTLSIPNRA